MSNESGPGRLVGRAAIVTGAARGIGAAIATRFAAEGAKLPILADVLDEEGWSLAASLGGLARYAHLDVRERDQWNSVVALCRESYDMDATVLVHNAGVMTAGSVTTTDENSLRFALDVNLIGPIVGSQACLPGMIAAGGGSIIVMSSIASISVGPGFIPYAVSKAANAAYARAAARELGAFGIRVNSLPGGVETPLNSGPEFANLDKDEWFGQMPIPRIGRPDEIAAAALYLACDDSSFVTGTQQVVDGGQLLGASNGWKS